MTLQVGQRHVYPWQPRITSLGHAVADRVVMTMDECMAYFGYSSPSMRKLAENTQIKLKRWWCDPIGKSVQELADEYEAGALELSCQAVQECLDGKGLSDIGTLMFVSCTQALPECPSMAFRVAGELGMAGDTRLVDIIGDGCQGAMPGLDAAYAYLLAFQRPVLLVATEICSATYFPASQSDMGNSISNLLFNDGSSAMILADSRDTQYPVVLDFERFWSKESKHLLGYIHHQGRMKVQLSRDVPKLVPPMVVRTINTLLARNGLTKDDISNWVIHNGGVAILKEIGELMEMDSEREFRYSWEILREYGNLSSATVGLIAEAMHRDPTNRQGWLVACAMGAGAGVGAALCRYG
jgi:alkylresorcinol/alkylpyrone synthase